jgi:dipeptidyl aminopeptidase/acylaminoacyl peptidase
MIRHLGLAGMAWLLLAADAPADPAAAFGARQSVESIRLSPDGSQIAYVAPGAGRSSALYVVDLASGQSRTTTRTDGETQELDWCNWVSNQRLVCSVSAIREIQGDPISASRLVALDRDGNNVVTLGNRHRGHGGANQRRWGGGIVDWLSAEQDHVLMLDGLPTSGRSNGGLGIVRLDTRTDKAKIIEHGVRFAETYLTDGKGRVRLMGVRRRHGETWMAADTVEYRYRAPDKDDWATLSTYADSSREGAYPLAVDDGLNAAYVLRKVDGRLALHRMPLDGSGKSELVLAHPEVDVDGVVRIGRSGRVIGATLATEKRQTVFFDPEYKKLGAALSKALPGLPLINFIDASADENRLLIWAGSDVDPGRYYTYDKQTKRLNEIMVARPQLEGMRLAPMKAVRYPAADGTMIPAYLTLPAGSDGRGLPAIVMPHGGPGARDEWGFDWLAQYYAARGFAVLQPNFRGSAGYGDAWFQENGFRSWRTAVGDVNDAGRWLVKEGVAAPERLAIVGWSYGGYAALQSGVLDPDLFRAVVAIAPVTDLTALKESGRWTIGYRLLRDFIGTGPHVREGSPAQNARALKAPVLLFHGELDMNVDLAQSKLMRERLNDAGKPTELITYPGLDHAIDDSAARADMLRRSDSFLRKALAL